MSSFKTFYLITRPIACLTTFIGTWAATVLFSGQLFAPQNIAAASAMTLFCLISSLYYAAMAHKPQQDSTISCKWLPLISGPAFPQWKKELLSIAVILFLIATIVVARYLPLTTFIVVFYTAWMVYRYTKLDGSEPFWLKRSMYGAGIAASCILFGGAAVDAGINPGGPNMYLLTGVIFFLYLLREILKHIQVARLFSTLKKYPINVGDKNPPAYLGGQGMLGIIALICIMPLVVMMLPFESWKYLASPNLIIGQFIATSVLIFMLWLIGSIIVGIFASLDYPPTVVRPLHGIHYLVHTVTK